MGHRFNPDHAERLLSERRQAMLPADSVLDALTLRRGMIFADVGVGPGYFALPAAIRTGAAVYAIDIEPRMLQQLRERADASSLCGQFEFLEGNACEIPLADESADRTLCSFVLHEVGDLQAAVAELARVTKASGVVGLAEWDKRPSDSGPPESERIARADLTAAARAAGFSRIDELQLNEEQYILICHK